jgi:imidazolonepropionase-like amidohydrolase
MGLFLTTFLVTATTTAQSVSELSDDARKFVKVDAPVVALTHVRVVDGTGAAALDDQTVVIADGKILSIGPSSEATLPADAEVLGLEEHTVIPGLVGMHNHMWYPAPRRDGPGTYNQHVFSFPRLYLAGGVTTARTTGSIEPYADLEIKKAIDAGRLVGPRIYVTSPYLEGKGSFTVQIHELTGPEDAVKMVEYWADLGVTSFKVYTHITRAQLSAAIEAAHERGIKVIGHICSIGFREAGGLLLTGPDPTGYGGIVAGFGDQRGIELLVEAGFTPLEAIRIGTLNGAKWLGEEERIGTLAPGKIADIVVLHGNPAENIANIENVTIVFKDGVGYDSAKLVESVRGSVGLR